jgi:hypothetical protein
VNGRLVTFDELSCPGTIANCRHLIRTVNLRTGAVVREAEARADGVEVFGAPNGSFVIWTDDGVIAQHLFVVGPEGSEEVASGRFGRESVAVGEGIVYWTDDAGTVHSAPVP